MNKEKKPEAVTYTKQYQELAMNQVQCNEPQCIMGNRLI